MKAIIFIQLLQRPPVRSAGGLGFPGCHLAHLDPIIVNLLAERIKNKTGDIFRGGVRVLKRLQLIQKGVIEFLDDFLCSLFDELEIYQNAVGPKLSARDINLDLPIMPMKVFALAAEFPELVGGSHLGNDLQLVHGCLLSMVACLGPSAGLAALRALPVDDDTGAGSIRTEDTVFQIKLLLNGNSLSFFLQRNTAIHAKSTSLRDHKTAL